MKKEPTRALTMAEMKSGQKAIITCFTSGPGMARKLENLGLLPGKIVEKVSNNPFRGPVVVRVDQTELAIGYGMARKITVEYI